MAKVIEFYILNNFRKSVRWTAAQERGRIVEFYLPIKKSA
jgi:hypothetical protein